MAWDGSQPLTRRGLVADDVLAHVEEMMMRHTRGSDGCLLGRIGLEHLAGGGKRIRARLALATCEAFGKPRMLAAPWAAAVELLHNASLIHDDLEDGDRVRRGRPTTWAVWGEAQAINAGDLLLLVPFVALGDLDAPGDVRAALSVALARAGAEMARGQAAEPGLLEVCAEGSDPWPAYEACVRGKTGALFGVPVEGAALLAGRSADDAATLGALFVDLGVLFQLQDDVLDLYGDKGRKKVGNDLREGKVSALVAEHLAVVERDTWLVDLLRAPREETSDAAVADAARIFVEGGALARVLRRIDELARHVRTAPLLQGAPLLQAVAEELIGAVLTPIAHLFAEPTVHRGADSRDSAA